MEPENQWYRIENEDEVFSPSLLVYPGRIESNIRKMVEMSEDVSRLRPHVKTHKMSEIIKMQMNHGINKFKCATVSEVEMVAGCGATYDFSKFSLRFDIRYNHNFISSSEVSAFDDVNGYEDIPSGEKFYYTDDINLISLKNIQFSFGFLYNLKYKVFQMYK